MIRRYGPSPDPEPRYRVRPGAYAVLALGDRVLLTWQGGIHDEFQLPGGGIDPLESPVRALHREVFEETGWRIAAPRRIGAFRRFVFMPDYGYHAEKICHVFIARPTLRIGPPSEPDHRPVWVPLSSAPDLVANSGDAAMLRAIASR